MQEDDDQLLGDFEVDDFDLEAITTVYDLFIHPNGISAPCISASLNFSRNCHLENSTIGIAEGFGH